MDREVWIFEEKRKFHLVSPDQGSVVDIFTDLNVWIGIRKVIDEINANAMVA